MLNRVLFFFTGLVFSMVSLTAQEADRTWMIGVNGAYQNTTGDWTDQFGDQYAVGASFGWKTKRNWLFYADWNFAFGGVVNEPEEILGPLITANEQLLNLNGNYATVTLYQRNTYASLNVNKVFSFWQINKNSGPSLGLGAGYLWHWIYIDNAGNDSPQINDDYARGYDRYSHGLFFRQEIGYLFMSRNRRFNFKLAYEFFQSFTEDQRGLNYTTGEFSEDIQQNFGHGIKLTWYIPIYRGGKTEEYYYH